MPLPHSICPNLFHPAVPESPAFRRWRSGIFAALLVLLWYPGNVSAHIGSPNVFFEGPAGSYPIRVTIQAPTVVPGLAQIHILVESGQADKVTVLPVYSGTGTTGAPPADVAKLVPGETNLYSAQLWLMYSGAYSVFVDVSGPQGHGTAIVPLNSVAMQRLTMPRGMSIMFLILGIFLLALLVSVVGAGVREAFLPAGIEPNRGRKIFAAAVMAISVIAMVGLVNFGSSWWNVVDREFLQERLYHSTSATPTVQAQPDGSRELTLELEQPDYRRADRSDLMPDHGHLIHLFLVRQPAGDVFAHLHPAREPKSPNTHFKTTLPNLPGGDYSLYADITHNSGLTETITNRIHLTAPVEQTTTNASDSDDSTNLEAPKSLGQAEVAGGFHVTPNFAGPFKANQDLTMRFDVSSASGAQVALEPYLGMYGHIIIEADDGSVFTHLHPLGTISMAAQKRFAEKEQAGYLANQPLDLLCSPARPILSFPYAFPKPGIYRLWLQFKIAGKILTSPYQIKVD